MAINNLVSGASAAVGNASGAGGAAAIAVLKKAIDLQSQGAAQLLETLPAAPAANPPHLGNRLDTFA
jgi:hypothetical protein